MRPQWFVRPPSIRPRNQSNVVPGACVYGSPSMSQPPMQPSNSPNGLIVVVAIAGVHAQQQALTPVNDQAAVDRGKALLVEQCGFCHGANARGGSGGPDLTRSVVVQEDEGGKQLGAFLRAGRPDRGMPKFDLPDAQMADLAAFLHSA